MNMSYFNEVHINIYNIYVIFLSIVSIFRVGRFIFILAWTVDWSQQQKHRWTLIIVQ